MDRPLNISQAALSETLEVEHQYALTLFAQDSNDTHPVYAPNSKKKGFLMYAPRTYIKALKIDIRQSKVSRNSHFFLICTFSNYFLFFFMLNQFSKGTACHNILGQHF